MQKPRLRVPIAAALSLAIALPCVPVRATVRTDWESGYEAGLADGAEGFSENDAGTYQQQIDALQGRGNGYASGYVEGWWNAWSARPAPTEYESGFSAGYRAGWADLEARENFDPAKAADGLTGEYRAAFLEGYSDGYSEAMDDDLEYELHAWDEEGFEPGKQPLIANGWPVKGRIRYRDGYAWTDNAFIRQVTGVELPHGWYPLREKFEQAGWDVVWNDANKQIILLNKQALMRQVLRRGGTGADPDFSALDALAAALRDGSLISAQERDISGSAKIQVRLPGAKPRTEKAFLSVSGHTRKNGLALDLSAPGSAVAGVLEAAGLASPGELEPGADPIKLTLSCDGKAFTAKSDLIAMLEPSLPDGAWTIPLPDPGKATVQALYDRYKAECATCADAHGAYLKFAGKLSLLDLLAGPGALSVKEGRFTYNLSTQAMNRAAARLSGIPGAAPFRDCEVRASVGPDGWNDLTVKLDPDPDRVAEIRSQGKDRIGKLVETWKARLLGVLADVRIQDGPESGNADVGMSLADGSSLEIHWEIDKNPETVEIAEPERIE